MVRLNGQNQMLSHVGTQRLLQVQLITYGISISYNQKIRLNYLWKTYWHASRLMSVLRLRMDAEMMHMWGIRVGRLNINIP